MSYSYDRVFGEDYSNEWFGGSDGSAKNVTFVWAMQEHANRLLEKQGYLYLNEVYMLLGYDDTGDYAGWIYDGENAVDFGIFHNPIDGMRWLKGRSDWVELHFNVEDDIREKARIAQELHLAGEGLPWS